MIVLGSYRQTKRSCQEGGTKVKRSWYRVGTAECVHSFAACILSDAICAQQQQQKKKLLTINYVYFYAIVLGSLSLSLSLYRYCCRSSCPKSARWGFLIHDHIIIITTLPVVVVTMHSGFFGPLEGRALEMEPQRLACIYLYVSSAHSL